MGLLPYSDKWVFEPVDFFSSLPHPITQHVDTYSSMKTTMDGLYEENEASESILNLERRLSEISNKK